MGVSGNSYAISGEKDGEIFVRPSICLNCNYKYPDNKYYVVLIALADALKNEVSIHGNVVFYCNNDLVAFDYQNEYLKNGYFPENIKFKNEWKKVTDMLKNKKINLTIKGENSMLSLVGMLQKQKGEQNE